MTKWKRKWNKNEWIQGHSRACNIAPMQNNMLKLLHILSSPVLVITCVQTVPFVEGVMVKTYLGMRTYLPSSVRLVCSDKLTNGKSFVLYLCFPFMWKYRPTTNGLHPCRMVSWVKLVLRSRDSGKIFPVEIIVCLIIFLICKKLPQYNHWSKYAITYGYFGPYGSALCPILRTDVIFFIFLHLAKRTSSWQRWGWGPLARHQWPKTRVTFEVRVETPNRRSLVGVRQLFYGMQFLRWSFNKQW